MQRAAERDLGAWLERDRGASAASLSRTQAAWVVSSATPAWRAARCGRVTTTVPLRASIRRLTRCARDDRRHSTGPGKTGHAGNCSVSPGRGRRPRLRLIHGS
ncbi:hypothetical protein ACFQY5_09035 [Paeniroseomonas aquatica]|uniref:hypothetical protein n=1 Tax=Paeniroseomonas aquatica TaxID=373043 RepID=UPI0036063871